MEIREYGNFQLEEITNLYQSVGWTNYLERISVLEDAYANSLCVIGAYDNEKLVGIIRAVGDGLTIVFIQDIVKWDCNARIAARIISRRIRAFQRKAEKHNSGLV